MQAKLTKRRIASYDFVADIDPAFVRIADHVLASDVYVTDVLRLAAKQCYRLDALLYQLPNKLWSSDYDNELKVHWSTVYHEGFHNFTVEEAGLDMTSVSGRHGILIECLGIGFIAYAFCMLGQHHNVAVLKESARFMRYIKGGQLQGVDFLSTFPSSTRQPFAVFRGVTRAVFAYYDAIYGAVLANGLTGGLLSQQRDRLAKSSWFPFFFGADITVPLIYATGRLSTVEAVASKRAIRRTFALMSRSISMSHFLEGYAAALNV